jgi:hypothetical protein
MALSVPNFVVGGQAAASTTAVTTTFSTTTGNTLVAAVRVNGAANLLSNVRNAAATNFTQIAASVITNSGVFQTTFLYYLANITGNATEAITANFSGSTPDTGICCWEIAGSTGIPDVATTGVNNANATTCPSSPFTTAFTNEIILAMGSFPQINETMSFSGGYTLDSAAFPTAAGAQYCAAAHQIVSTGQSSVTVTITASSSIAGSTLSVASFIQVGSPPSGGGNLGPGYDLLLRM